MVKRNYKIGLIGLGWWGKRLFGYFNSLEYVNITSVCDVSGRVPDGLDLNGAKLYTDSKEMFEIEKMDGVIIATPPAFHLEAAIQAAEHGVHVFCEKPMASTVEDCDAMIEVCKRNNVKLFIAFKHRYAKACKYVKDNAGKFGRPLFVMYTAPLFPVNDPGWKFKPGQCSGVILENAVHYIDNLRYLVGDIERIYSEGDIYMFKNAHVPDTAISTIRFKNGAIGGLGCGATSDISITSEYLDIHFEHAVAQIWGRLDLPFNLKICTREDSFVEEHKFDGSDGVMEEIRHFFECIENGDEPLANGNDGREAVHIALKIIESATKKKILEV